MCLAIGPLVDAVDITLTISMNFKDCYKVLIPNFFDLKIDSGLFDNCIDSNSENVQVYSY